ncbi:MAG: DNA-processing protein DprA [Faecalibacterium sp.]|jgi:DNA processing protein|nr:DNA-processing protein DprA [Faecalibacterium sp.]
MNENVTPLETLAQTGALPGPEPESPPEAYWMWLAVLLGTANLHAGRLIDRYGTARAAWEARDTAEFHALAGPTAVHNLKKGETPAAYLPVLAWCARHSVWVLPFDDPSFPLALSRIPDPPLVLYCTGDVTVLGLPHTVGMVGARKPTQYGASAAAVLGDALAQSGAVIVSGMADGLDSEAHKAAVRAHAPTVAVLGVPISVTYPAANAALRANIERRGAVISEYAPGAPCDYHVTFLQRNRIIAALSGALVVVEARLKSGTMSTVAHAERYGRPIFAVPGSIFSPLSEGTNTLLREKRAAAAVEPSDILAAVGLRGAAIAPAEPKPAPELPETARRVLACIGARPVGLGMLCEQTGLPMNTLLTAISRLQIAGMIAAQPGQKYILK